MMMFALAAASSACILPTGAGADASTQQNAFAMRSIEIVALAAAGQETKLTSLISPEAEFSIGAGDVGRPLGKGVEGARKFADDLKAATYVFKGWDYIPMSQDGCGPVEVEVEFVTNAGNQSANIKFKYEAGLLKSAAGWWRSRNTGEVRLEASNG